jgi:hypothetical protein
MTDIQKIVVTLSDSNIEIEPGSFAQLTVKMKNLQESADRLLLEVEGIDVEWYGIPVSAVNLEAGGEGEERINFKIARSNDCRAGSYPFLVRVRAMETGAVGVAQATLTIKPFVNLQVDLSPKRGVASFIQPVHEFSLNINHQGNNEETFDLYASDAEDACIYEFDQERVTIAPGQSKQIPLFVRPKTSSVVGSGRLYGFTVSARATSLSHVAANTHGQIERRSLISPLLGIFLILFVMGGFGAWYFWPRPLQPLKIHAFSAVPLQIMQGGTITLSWDAQPNYEQILLFKRQGDQNPIAETTQPNAAVGSIIVTPQAPQTTYVLELRRNNRVEKRAEVTVKVSVPPPAPKPSLAYLRVEPDKVHEGESVLLSWKANGATRILLDPGSVEVPLYEQTRNLVVERDTTFTIRVIGQNPQDFVEKSIKVTAVPKDVCLAEITAFGTANKTVYVGDKVKVVWQSRYAKVVRLDYDKGSLGEMSRKSGSFELPTPIVEPTTVVLTVLDTLGKSTSKQIVITPQQHPVVPPDGTTPEGTNPGDPTKPIENPNPNPANPNTPNAPPTKGGQ